MADGPRAGVLGQRAEEHVDGQEQALAGVAFGQAAAGRPRWSSRCRRQQVDGVGLDRHAVLGPLHLSSVCGASSSSITLLKSGDRCWTTTNEKPAGRRHAREQPLQRLQAAGGRADADDIQRLGRCRLGVLDRGRGRGGQADRFRNARGFRLDGRHWAVAGSEGGSSSLRRSPPVARKAPRGTSTPGTTSGGTPEALRRGAGMPVGPGAQPGIGYWLADVGQRGGDLGRAHLLFWPRARSRCASRTMSASNRMPISLPPRSTTGRRRIWFLRISSSAATRLSSGEQLCSDFDMAAATFNAWGADPFIQVDMQMSRSVTITTRSSVSTTGSTPQSRVHIRSAAALRGSSRWQVATFVVIRVAIFIRHLLCRSKMRPASPRGHRDCRFNARARILSIVPVATAW